MNDYPLSHLFRTVCDRHLLIYSVHRGGKKIKKKSQVNTRKFKTMTKTTCQENRETFSICQTAQAKKNLTVPQFGQKLKEKKKTSQSGTVDYFECFSD